MLFHIGGQETHMREVWVQWIVEGQRTRTLAAMRPGVVLTTHQPTSWGSCLGKGGLVTAVQVLAPGIPQVVSKGFDQERLFRGKLRRALLLRKSLQKKPFHIVAV